MGAFRLSPDWRAELEGKICSPEEAVKAVKPGDNLWVPPGGGGPSVLTALAARQDELKDLHIRALGLPDLGWYQAESMDTFDIQLQFCGIGGSREALNDRICDYQPYWMFNNHKALDAGREEGWPIDVAFVTVSEPNEGGYCSFGGAIWDGPTAARRARTVIAEMNPNVPETYGETYLHVSELDYVFPDARPVAPAPLAEITDADRAIAHHVGSLVKDGDTIQVGVGSHTGLIARLGAFDERQDLSYFAEMTVGGIVDLVQRGVINGKYAYLHPNTCVATMLGNSAEDFATINRNPAFRGFPLEQQANPRIIAQNENIVAVNGALGIDLTGQIAVGSIGSRYYAGVGGHLAYAMGATLAPKGRYVCVMTATDRSGTISTIVPQFPAGQVVTVPRELADTVVTEYGVARLLGRNFRARAEELIAIAHPDHRAELRRAAQKLFYP